MAAKLSVEKGRDAVSWEACLKFKVNLACVVFCVRAIFGRRTSCSFFFALFCLQTSVKNLTAASSLPDKKFSDMALDEQQKVVDLPQLKILLDA